MSSNLDSRQSQKLAGKHKLDCDPHTRHLCVAHLASTYSRVSVELGKRLAHGYKDDPNSPIGKKQYVARCEVDCRQLAMCQLGLR